MTYPISTLFLLKVSVVSDFKNVTGRDGTEHNGITRVQNRVSRKQKLKKERKEVDGDLIYSPFFFFVLVFVMVVFLSSFVLLFSFLFVCLLVESGSVTRRQIEKKK